MQNKGFVRLLAAALMLICLFYLSFSVVTNNYDKKAKAYANGDDQEYYNFMDSVGGEKVWLGYTLRECREKEIVIKEVDKKIESLMKEKEWHEERLARATNSINVARKRIDELKKAHR